MVALKNKLMKIKIILLLIWSAYTLTSCSGTTTNNNNQKDETEVAENRSLVGEDFDSFLEKFNRKPTFQRQRVLFPLEATVLDPSEYGMETVKEKVEYQDWLLLDFTYDSTYAMRQMDSYEQRINLYSDSVRIEQRGVNNGIYANFLFTKKDGKWFLKSFTDVSY